MVLKRFLQFGFDIRSILYENLPSPVLWPVLPDGCEVLLVRVVEAAHDHEGVVLQKNNNPELEYIIFKLAVSIWWEITFGAVPA